MRRAVSGGSWPVANTAASPVHTTTTSPIRARCVGLTGPNIPVAPPSSRRWTPPPAVQHLAPGGLHIDSGPRPGVQVAHPRVAGDHPHPRAQPWVGVEVDA